MCRSPSSCFWLVPVLAVVVAVACESSPPLDPVEDDANEDVEVDSVYAGVMWLRQNAVQIENARPDQADAALAVFQQTIGDASLVGLGEGTHGTAEFWGVRQKISRYLVEEMGFTAILYESPFPSSLPINAYVTEGEGTAEEAHRSLRVWRYQEMRDLINWVRMHNMSLLAEEPAVQLLADIKQSALPPSLVVYQARDPPYLRHAFDLNACPALDTYIYVLSSRPIPGADLACAPAESPYDLGDVRRLLRSSHVGLGDRLHQRHAQAVRQINPVMSDV